MQRNFDEVCFFVSVCSNFWFRYPEYNATIFDGDSAILDLLLTVKLDLIGSMAVTVVCMSLVCSIFIHNHMGAIIVAFTIGSVCFGKLKKVVLK